MQALSNRPVYGSQWDSREPNNMPHINLSRGADAILIAPCSADFMAKLLHGHADELLSLMCLARPIDKVPLLLAPAMNREMWAHPATQRNMAQLAADGAHILGVGTGFQLAFALGQLVQEAYDTAERKRQDARLLAVGDPRGAQEGEGEEDREPQGPRGLAVHNLTPVCDACRLITACRAIAFRRTPT
jgi:phosphopantothenoylcysteine synthetase/decarboxylase